VARIQAKNFGNPDELVTFERGSSAEVHISELAVGKQVLEPGWRWSTHVKPIVGTPTCRFHHLGHQCGIEHRQAVDRAALS
jgi:hypothetical protein